MSARAPVSVVVPVFNSAATLPVLAARLAAALPAVAGDFEVLLVNDGSADDSWEVIGELARRYPWIRGIDLARNYGQYNATLCGVRRTRFARVVTMDDDLEHRPESVGALLRGLEEGAEMVYGTVARPPRGWVRKTGRFLARRVLLRELGPDGSLELTAFRAFTGGVRDALPRHTGAAVSLDVLLARRVGRIAYVAVECGARQSGRSNYSLAKLVAGSLRLMVQASTAPLWVSGAAALLAAGTGAWCAEAGLRGWARGLALASLLLAGQAGVLAVYRLRPRPSYRVRAETEAVHG